MKTFALVSLGTFLIGTAAFASAWNPSTENPNFFNVSYNTNTEYETNLAQLPASSMLPKEKTPWSDSYWPKDHGAFAYRWHAFENPNVNESTSVQDRQKNFFSYHKYSKQELKNLPNQSGGQQILDSLSPLEKYSIYTGDYHYSLVNEYLTGNGNGPGRAYWEGYCEPWSAAATHYAEPAPVTRVNKDGIAMNFGSADVKALLIAFADQSMNPSGMSRVFNHPSRLNSIGSRCNTSVSFLYPGMKMHNGLPEMSDYGDYDGLPDTALEQTVMTYQAALRQVATQNPTSVTLPTDPSGQLSPAEYSLRIANDASLPAKSRALANECKGVNAGAFHLVMTNQIGVLQKGFDFDKTRDGQVWNQPARGYTSTIQPNGGPLSTSAPGTVSTVMVTTYLQYADDTDYGWAFWNPTLTGLFGGDASAFMQEYDLYNQLLVNQGDADASKLPKYPTNIIDGTHYQYTLDLDANGNIIGGDWISLERPDSLWITDFGSDPSKGFGNGDFKHLGEIYQPANLE